MKIIEDITYWYNISDWCGSIHFNVDYLLSIVKCLYTDFLLFVLEGEHIVTEGWYSQTNSDWMQKKSTKK